MQNLMYRLEIKYLLVLFYVLLKLGTFDLKLESDINGKIVKILVENETPIEYNQVLFLIEKE